MRVFQRSIDWKENEFKDDDSLEDLNVERKEEDWTMENIVEVEAIISVKVRMD